MARPIFLISTFAIGAAAIGALVASNWPEDIVTAADQRAAANEPTIPVDRGVAPDGTPTAQADLDDPYIVPTAPDHMKDGQADAPRAPADDLPAIARSAISTVVAISDQVAQQPASPAGMNDEADPTASAIGASEAQTAQDIARILSPETFSAESVVALIQAAPDLSQTQKYDLQVAIQAVAMHPDARRKVLTLLEGILISQI